MKKITQYHLIVFAALFFALFDNSSFFSNVVEAYPLTFVNALFIVSLFVVLVSFITALFTLFSSRYTTKPILIIILLVSSFTSFFMDTYHVVIDDSMIQNSLQTDLHESLDLLSFKLVFTVLFLGILPSVLVYRQKISYGTLKKELVLKSKVVLISLTVIIITMLALSKFYTSFTREHKPLRFYTNPTYWIYSVGSLVANTFSSKEDTTECIGNDACVRPDPDGRDESKELVILVVGEAARADRFSLNGYERETTPLLQKEDIVNFSNMHSCGTSTAVSVPCMFSIYGKDDFSYEKGVSTENVLDTLVHTHDIDILWRDNNSDPKGVMNRLTYEDYKTATNNTVCDEECRDEGMLVGLDKYIKEHKDRDILIILHQMGNHGPAYYKRYPKSFEKFTPVCETNQLEECTTEEISNAYDNAILYTDYFLSKVINFLKPYSKDHETAMMYISDHGESLGESGLYLHGLPYFMAPDTQTHVGSFMWFGGEIKNEIDVEKLRKYRDEEFTQDNLFSTILGIFEVNTTVYDPKMDILYKSKVHPDK